VELGYWHLCYESMLSSLCSACKAWTVNKIVHS
jgi:hypothetical protein